MRNYPNSVLVDFGPVSYPAKFEKVIFSPPATIVFWDDGTKTVVKCGVCDVYDPEKGVALCFMKKALGNHGNYNYILNDCVKQYEDEQERIATRFGDLLAVLETFNVRKPCDSTEPCPE